MEDLERRSGKLEAVERLRFLEEWKWHGIGDVVPVFPQEWL